jgi:DNA-binding transcriptional ArsR family regulator
MRILQMLDKRSRSVNEIVDFFALTQPTISRHLKVLKEAGLVKVDRNGQKMIYSLNTDSLREVASGYLRSFRCLSQK